jgi:serine phosphatase RsbU (regulator of sigma subunit)
MAGDHGSALPRRRGPDLAGLAAFTLDSGGRVTSWPASAERLFGHPAPSVTGQDVRAVLMTGPGQRELAGEALAEVAAGRVWTATVSMAFAGGSGPVALRWEPLGGPEAGVLVIGQHVSPAIGAGWLREAADRIGTTLDLPRTAREVADVAVPAFADVAAIFMFERLLAADEPVSPQAGHGAVMRRLVARLAGQPTAATDSVLRPGEVMVFGDDSPSFRAMHTRGPVLYDRLDEESAERIARRPGGRELASNWASFLSVPLVARGVVLGCATFGRAPQSPDFGPADIAAAGELASRAAVCIDNARLYHRERRTAFALQRGLLPGEPPVPEGMEVAHRYLPVGASMVGGDWHDIVALPGRRVAVVVGDAMGHGPEAAAVMVQLRTATHLLAGLDVPPGEVLARLDTLTAGMPSSPYATCMCAVIDTSASTCVIAGAGHPPPVLALPGGATEVLSVPAGLPLGLSTGTFESAEVSLPPGATLALYTDGLAESRTRPLEDGITALRDGLGSALAQPGVSLDSACETITQALRQRGEDDITLVLARIRL